jgi:hypothetical protein
MPRSRQPMAKRVDQRPRSGSIVRRHITDPRDLSLPSFRGHKRNEQRAKQDHYPRLMTDHFHWLCSMLVGYDVTVWDLEVQIQWSTA